MYMAKSKTVTKLLCLCSLDQGLKWANLVIQSKKRVGALVWKLGLMQTLLLFVSFSLSVRLLNKMHFNHQRC